MRAAYTHARFHVHLLCCLLSYALMATSLALPAWEAEASAGRSHSAVKAPHSAAAKMAQADAPHRDGELIVRFRSSLSEQGKDDVARGHGARRKGELRGESGAERLELPAGQDPASVAEQMRARPEVELAEPNFLVRRDEVTPNDPRFSEQWALRNTGQAGGAVGSDIHASSAWQETTGSASTVVAVIDSGIDFTHPDLKNNEWTNTSEVAGNGRDDDKDGYVDDTNGWDWVTGSGVIRDEAGHGTAVAGIIAAEGNNSEGVSGVMWHASLMSLRVLDSTGTGDVASAVEAIDYAVAHGASVINCSWGTDAGSQLLKDAIDRAGKRGVVVVASAGNSARDIDAQAYYPASYNLPNLIAVASSDGFDNLASFSNWGAATVAVAAPGTAILTTQVGGNYWSVSGTSASAPLVAGIAGLIKMLRPNAPAAGVRSAIAGGARRVDALAGKVSSGGVADAEGALAALNGNPYAGNGNGGNGNGHGNGQGNGNGQGDGNGQGYVPPALRHDNDHGRAMAHSGLVVDPPAAVKGAPAAHLPNLDESRKVRNSPTTSSNAGTIHADLACADCASGWSGGAGGWGSPPVLHDNPLVVGQTTVQSRHITELRDAIDALRSHMNMSGYPWQASAAVGALIKADPIIEMRTALNQALGAPASGYSAGLAPTQPIKAIHIQELRDRVLGAWQGGGAGGSDPYFGTARARKANETGNAGVTLGSRNFNWGLPLVSLSGRSGLDLSLVLYYNSLVWTRQGTSIEYNPDHGTPAPGFQLGLPRLQAQYLDSDVNVNAYIMVTPSGGRVEMRQSGTSGVYESADSTYTQLTFPGGVPVVRTTDGTQYVFGTAVMGEWRCTSIEDRNGNYISATYDGQTGHLLSVTDTLGRTVSFNYDADNNLSTITQAWGGVTHTYATFVYGSVPLSVNFPGLALYGLSGSTKTVLSYVVFPDNESYFFDYNSYAQVYQIRHKAPDGHELGHARYNMSDSDIAGAALDDCPRFTNRYDYAQDWNGGAEAVTSYSVTSGATWTNPETGAQETGTLVQQTTPDGTLYKDYSHSDGWDAGLTRLSEVWAVVNGTPARKKYTSTAWTQDDETLTYTKNPRVSEVNIYDDAGNRRRTTIDYMDGYGLPTHVREWGGANGQTLLRLTVTNHKMDADYVNRRIIGLPYEHVVYDGPTGNVMSREVYYYDRQGGDGMGNTYFSAQAPSTQYDSAGYPSSFVVGRGDLSAVQRFNCSNNTTAYDGNQATWERLNGYDMAGCLVWSEDSLGHKTSVSYADNFSDASKNGLNTLAYPTSVTDADGYTSATQYNYDFGAVTAASTPTSGTASTGVTYASVAVQYDSFGRVQQETNQTSGTYRRFVYETNDNYVHTYQTITGTTQASEFHSWQVLDGAGRVRASASDHPGSTGGFTGQYVVYDQMGRVVQQSNPMEMTGGWVQAGDDSGWVTTTQSYDYKGRPVQTTNADGTTKVLAYGGCGCAGGEVTTAQDEHGRQKRYTKDTLGRLVTAEELNWDGSVYSTTSYSYNALDQMKQIGQAGQTPRTFGYDGFGRLSSRTTPEQGATSYSYNADDTVGTVTDARGASASFIYNGRHLVTNINYGVAAGVASTPNVTFTYDAAGNRTSMTDGQGSAAYHYDSQSRMDWEERSFNGVGTFRLSYSYNAGGELTSVTNPWGAQVSYSYDAAGRLSAVGGANYAGVSNYVSGISYRAFGSLKEMAYANGRAFSASYDSRLRPSSWNVSGVLGYNYSYDYFNERTGRVSYAQSLYDSTLDRSYEYDNVGRLAISHSGAEARAHTGQGQWGVMDGPYSQGYDYDQWGNVTHRYGWGGEVQGGGAGQTSDHFYTYSNNRRTDSGFTYDAAGNLTFDGGQHFTYDAAGNQTYVDWTNLSQGYDGDGLRVQRTEDGTYAALYLRSSVLGGQVVAEMDNVNGTWQWQRGYVYAGSQLLAVQQGGVFFVHEDPVTKSKRVTDMAGVVQSAVELDPYGADTSRSSNSAFQPRKFTSYERDANGTDEAMFRRYNRWHSRFDQPDPTDSSYDLSDPQSFNRYAYVGNDPVNFTDPTGLDTCSIDPATGQTVCIPDFHVDGGTVHGGVGNGGEVSGLFGSGSEHVALENMPGETSGDTGGGPQNSNAERLREVINAAKQALENSPCRDLFSPDVDPVSLLNEFASGKSKKGIILMDKIDKNYDGLTDLLGGVVAPKYAAIILSDRKRSIKDTAITLIHELGHSVDWLYGDDKSKIKFDANNKKQSVANRKLVSKECSRFLKGL